MTVASPIPEVSLSATESSNSYFARLKEVIASCKTRARVYQIPVTKHGVIFTTTSKDIALELVTMAPDGQCTFAGFLLEAFASEGSSMILMYPMSDNNRRALMVVKTQAPDGNHCLTFSAAAN